MRSVSVVLILAVVVVAVATASPVNGKPHYDLSDAPALFEKFMKDYNRHYKDEEDNYLHYFALFTNLVKVNSLNQDESSGSAWYDINLFADFTKEEFKRMQGIPSTSDK